MTELTYFRKGTADEAPETLETELLKQLVPKVSRSPVPQ